MQCRNAFNKYEDYCYRFLDHTNGKLTFNENYSFEKKIAHFLLDHLILIERMWMISFKKLFQLGI